MDPNATLGQMLRLATAILEDDEANDTPAAVNLAELVEALDGWIRKGGCLPTPWEVTRRSRGPAPSTGPQAQTR